jgi:hypothetical protein
LHSEGLVAAAPLRWGARIDGTFAEVTGNFTVASAHLPGNVLRASLATTIDDNRAGELLLSGQGQPGDPNYVERPGDPSYGIGAADYAGLNFRVGSDGAQTATSLIGDASVGPYALRGSTKYYTRPAGVSGIHEAVTASFAALANALTVRGFSLSLNNFQLSFLDNHVHASLISGTVNVPGVRAEANGKEAQEFLDNWHANHEVVDSEPGLYRQRELIGNRFKAFELTSLLPKESFDVHLSKMAE